VSCQARPPRQLAAARLEHVEAALMLDARVDVRTEDAVFSEQQRRHTRDRRRAVHLEIRNPAGAHVPALQDEPRVIHAVVVMEVAEERMRHVGPPAPAFEEPMMRPRTMIQYEQIATDLDEIAGALAFERRRRSPSTEKSDLQ
jgi:hypothetical protein